MRFSPSLLLAGAVLGSLIVAFFGYIIAAGASPLPAPPAKTGVEVAPANSSSLAAAAPLQQNQESVEPAASESNQQAPEESQGSGACAVSDRFPESIRQWCDLITRFANDRSLDPNLVAAMMLQESGGDHLAYSQSGAVGLMQVMPRDGLAANFMCINGPCFSSRPTIEELQDPEFNVEYGTGMIANLIGRYGSIRDALKAYGPHDVGYYYADKILGILENYK